MAGKTLLALLSELHTINIKMDDMDERMDVLKSDVVKTIKPEFQNEFSEFVDHMHIDGPSVEFLAYWESNEECRKAIKIIIEAHVTAIEEVLNAVREVANWRPSSTDLQST